MVAINANDTFFISHGSPTFLMKDSVETKHFLEDWKHLKFGTTPPKAILIVSGHWETDEPCLGAVNGRFDTIYDFNGVEFPDAAYKIKYPAPGAPDLAKRAQELLTGSGFKRVHVDKERGLDHGIWVPLKLMYPEANVPICQLSVQSHLDGTHHYNVGRALAPLRKEGVLIIGSGSATHNLEELHLNPKEVVQWAKDFDSWLEEALTNGRFQDVNDFEKKAPHAKRAHPCPEHFYPINVAMGAAGEKAKAELIHRTWDRGTMSSASYMFTNIPT